ncbi:MAG: hypothetical protein Q7S51_05805, partial [Gallionellaceae bacterium]|nr:hypothetical protein [Gallionellaceae bacterium]
MANLIPPLEFPPLLREHIKTLCSFFPDKVRFDKEDHSVTVTEEMSVELRVSISYFKLVTDVQDVMENIELILSDLNGIAIHPPTNALEGKRRYFLLT